MKVIFINAYVKYKWFSLLIFVDCVINVHFEHIYQKNSHIFLIDNAYDNYIHNVSYFHQKKLNQCCWKDNLLNDKCARSHLIEIDERRINAFSLRLTSRHRTQNSLRFALYLKTTRNSCSHCSCLESCS